MAVSVVLWDLDGTLIQSEDIHLDSIVHACALHGLQLETPLRLPPGLDGPGVYRILFGLAPSAPLPSTYHDWYGATVEYVLRHVQRAEPATAAVDFCKWLAQQGVAQTLVSNSSPPILDASLRHLGLRAHFHHLCSGDQFARGKPEPQVYLHAARLHGVDVKECLAFEDSLNGVMAAKAAGIRVIALSDDENVRRAADAFIPSGDAACWASVRRKFESDFDWEAAPA
ncbi:HAD family phosphatase [Massilia sp. erpn]|uniref:HAD family hydrolase n=1 Tax=Massilia sp. erpn TaxID=2738142 RepID=UPI0021056603|nr:HAD family phosphatase [Massilia sp. erpn]UTY57633.1 HAD family phosphatase [Massilia sp. erpn]